MFIPAFKTAAIFSADGEVSLTGEKTVKPKAFQVGWSPIYLRNDEIQTAVRADSSASKSRADINAGESRIVLDKKCTTVRSGDIVLLPPDQTFNEDPRYKITRLKPMHDIFGRLHHFEVDLMKVKDGVDYKPYAVKNAAGVISNFKAV